MTALPGRRRRTTLLAGIGAGVALVVVIALTIAGAFVLYHSTDGSDAAAANDDELVFPETPVAAIAALDSTGRLASLAVLVVQPAGTGGSIVTVPVNADATAGVGDDRLPLDETLGVQGQDAFRSDLDAVLRLGVDDIAFVDASALTEMLAPIGTIQVELPADVVDADGEIVAQRGAAQLDAAAAAAVLTARDPAIPAAEQYPAANAVWAAVAAAIGPGIGATDDTTATVAPTSTPAVADPVGALFTDLIAGRVGARALRALPVAAEDNPRGVDVSSLDPAEVLLVFAQISPGAVSAPGAGLSFRIVSAFTEEQLAGSGLTNTEVAYRAIQAVLVSGGNVVSVATVGEAPAGPSELAVADASMIEGASQIEEMIGPVTTSVADQPIAGVDVVATLGTDAIPALVELGSAPSTTTVAADSSATSTSAPAATSTDTEPTDD